jgi:hypothetical protein
LTKEQNEIKTISFETLKRLSDYNVERLNRNIDVNTLLQEFPNITTQNIDLRRIEKQYHNMEELTDQHFRCFVCVEEYGGCIGTQDVFDYQWEELN